MLLGTAMFRNEPVERGGERTSALKRLVEKSSGMGHFRVFAGDCGRRNWPMIQRERRLLVIQRRDQPSMKCGEVQMIQQTVKRSQTAMPFPELEELAIGSAQNLPFRASHPPRSWVLVLIGRAITAPIRSSTMANRGVQKHLRSLTEVVVDFVWCKTCGTKYEGELSDCLRLGHELIERQVKTLKLV